MKDSTQWRKALWSPQDYPDNHTDDNFLESLVINADVVQRKYLPIVREALAVDHQLSLVTCIATTAWHLHQGTLNATTLLTIDFILLIAGSLFYLVFSSSSSSSSSLASSPCPSVVAHIAGLILFTALLSPVYATLTSSISPDTIVACTFLLLTAHLYLHDYSPSPSTTSTTLTGSVGLVCGLCGSVLMASQLHTLLQVFTLVRNL